jgi:predicted secreted hydrolase
MSRRPSAPFPRLLPLLLALAFSAACSSGADPVPTPRADPAGPDAEAFLSAFERVDGPQPLAFPKDDGPHPGYLTEWWYYTGNLESDAGRHFGFQLTFFRRAAAPPGSVPERPSDWAAEQIYFAHFALTDVAGDGFYSWERFSRGAAGLAGAQADPYRVWLEDWSVASNGDGGYRLIAAQGDIRIDLDLDDLKGRTLHGESGYSRKGSDPGNASIYISQTRLEAAGSVTVGGANHAVTGLAWMDHEYSTSALGPDEVGWDWFSMHLDDGSELMLFQLRRADGGISPYSSGSLIEPDGSVRHLSVEDFSIAVERFWTSPHSGAEYPAGWTIEIPAFEIRLELEPVIADQELQLSFVYWEGATMVSGSRGGLPVSGSGYVELTGYAHSMQGEF